MLVSPKRYGDSGSGPAIVTWADGTDEEIAAMISAADAGKINLSDYWSLGDERTVHLDAMTVGDAFTTAMAAQDVVLVLMDTGINSGYKDVNNKTVNFVVGQKNSLSKTGRMNTTDTNTGSWNGCAMRTDLNNKYYNALPATFRACLKQFKTITAQTYNGSTNQISQDYIALFAEKEVIGSTYYNNPTEANALTQVDYYKTTANRIKKNGNGYDCYWWERSPHYGDRGSFCMVELRGYAEGGQAKDSYGIAPFMCI